MNDITDYKLKYSELSRYAEKQLSPARFAHCRNTAELAVDLCNRFHADPEKGFIAGLLHDITREWEPFKMTAYALCDGDAVSPLEREIPILLHARAGAMVLQNKFQIGDDTILQAVRNHISGKIGMSLLSKIIFIADYLEPGRKFLSSTEQQRVLQGDLDFMLLYVTEKTIEHLKQEEKLIPDATLVMYRELQDNAKGRV